MSTFYPYRLTCPACGHTHQVEVARGIHITRLPRARQQILDGTFQRFACPSCEHRVAVEGPAIYTDFHRGHYVAVETAARATRQGAALRHQLLFEDSFAHGPPLAQELGRRFLRRIVFGLGGLREKLLLWDGNYDDYVVEALKGDRLRERGLDPDEHMLRLARILEGGHLLFALMPRPPRPAAIDGAPRLVPATAPTDFETISADAYRARLADRQRISHDFPWLGDEWFVDIGEGDRALRP